KSEESINKLNVGKISIEQRSHFEEVLRKHQNLFAHELCELDQMTVVQHKIYTEEGPLIKQ
ncbi:14725_t:CDS:1, partial [Racocetra persica]